MHQGKRRRRLNLGRSIAQDKLLLQAILVCVYLVLRHEGAVLMAPYMSLPTSTTTAGELLHYINVLRLVNRQSFMLGQIAKNW